MYAYIVTSSGVQVSTHRQVCHKGAAEILSLKNEKHSIQSLKSPGLVGHTNTQLGGVFSGGVPPDSIPNSEVKPACGENSAEVARCKNSTMPPFNLKAPTSIDVGAFLFSRIFP